MILSCSCLCLSGRLMMCLWLNVLVKFVLLDCVWLSVSVCFVVLYMIWVLIELLVECWMIRFVCVVCCGEIVIVMCWMILCVVVDSGWVVELIVRLFLCMVGWLLVYVLNVVVGVMMRVGLLLIVFSDSLCGSVVVLCYGVVGILVV